MHSSCRSVRSSCQSIIDSAVGPMLLGFRRSAYAPVPPRHCLTTPRFVKSRMVSFDSVANITTAETQDQPWRSLGTPPQQLLLHNTLPTGQSFRWRLTEPDTYTGVIGQRVVQLKQLQDDVQWRVLARGSCALPEADAAALHDYFNLDADLAAFYSEWSTRDERFQKLAPYLPGARMLRQDPVETLFQFICSSNNHISRIHGMVERLCSTYGSELMPSSSSSCSSLGSNATQYQQMHKSESSIPQTPDRQQQQQQAGSQPPSLINAAVKSLESISAGMDMPFNAATAVSAAAETLEGVVEASSVAQLQLQRPAQPPSTLAFYAFPTLQQLSAATEEALRASGFGYRAKFIVGSVQQLLSKPEGGEAWLLNLRSQPYTEAQEALCTLPGIGPKVAACISLFSLDKHDAIPVDTHVWDLATKYYAPHLAKKTLNKKLHDEIQQVFVSRFGPYAGWAHNTLFISELASHRHLRPAGLAGAAGTAAKKAGQQKKENKRPLAAVAAAEETAVSIHSAATKAGLDACAAASLVEAEAALILDGVYTGGAAGLEIASRRSRRTRKRSIRFSTSGGESSDA